MKNTVKHKFLDFFSKSLIINHADLAELKRKKIAEELSEEALQILVDNNDGLAKILGDTLHDLEKHRNLFRQHIEFLQLKSGIVINKLREDRFVSYDIDKKTNRKILVGKTSLVTDMVAFMNQLDKMVEDFYREVYKFEDDSKDAPTQTTLF